MRQAKDIGGRAKAGGRSPTDGVATGQRRAPVRSGGRAARWGAGRGRNALAGRARASGTKRERPVGPEESGMGKDGDMQSTTLHWNTGRLYSAKGQRITATLYSDRTVTFWDHDRQIDGEFRLCGDFLPEAVMDAYDQGIAKSTERSWKDAMLEGGCNNEYHGKGGI